MKNDQFYRLIKTGIFIAAVFTTPLLVAKPSDFDSKKFGFVKEMSDKYSYDYPELRQIMAKANYQQKIIDAISRPAEAMPWYRYRRIFLKEDRIREGVEFWRANTDLLRRAENEYGVPPEIIVAIIGVESRYGKHDGGYLVIDALSTLAFGYPKRSSFFRKELEEFLLLVREEEISPLAVKGSYAGAMGKPQFIPSSYRAYAVDFDGDGKRDLMENNSDVIGSVAAYFKSHGWRQSKPVTTRAKGVNEKHKHFIDAGMKPRIRIDQLRKSGLEFDPSLPANAISSLIRLEGNTGDEYWLGLKNFYTITRYNHSNLYAMAVYQLSQEILQQYRVQGR